MTSASLQLEYRGTILNLLDTPGHADFSEDTYRVLAAVDAAVMLVDAAKGIEPQTMKLFAVCRHRRIPIITVINKWDRPGRDALELIDEIREATGLEPTPLTWPVGPAGDFRGFLDRDSGELVTIDASASGRHLGHEQIRSPAEAAQAKVDGWDQAIEESDLLSASGADPDQETFLEGIASPVLFTAAVRHIGISRVLDALVDIAPAPTPRPDIAGQVRGLDAPFSAFTFKVQAGMDPAHRDRLAFIRICSGVFRRGMTATTARTGKPFAMKYAHLPFGRDRDRSDLAYPGDVIGLVNATALTIGDTLYEDPPVEFPGLPRFAPEHFAVATPADRGRTKQFRRGVDQLESEGVIQVLRSERRGEGVPVLAAVGTMQFDVVEHRLTHEFRSAPRWETLPYSVARRTDEDSAAVLEIISGVEVLRRGDSELLAVFSDQWRARGVERAREELALEPLIAA